MDDKGDLAPTERFSSRVGHYAKSRPGYPAGVIELLSRETGMKPNSVLADVGSGTGILTELFLRNGNTVFAVEPNREMREAAERALSRYPGFKSVNATAESTTLADHRVDGVVCAQAFHWFDGPKAVAEFGRIIDENGFAALIWNVRDTNASEFMKEYERIVLTYGSSFARSGKELVPLERLQELFGWELIVRTLPNHQELDWEGLRGRILSASYMPMEGQPGFEEMMRDLREVFERNQEEGRVRMDYQTRVYLD